MRVASRRAALVAGHHLGRTGAGVVEVTGDLLALHSSDPLTPHLALWARVPDYRPDDLDAALVQTRSLWRLHAMRRTLWVAASDEVGVLHGATGQAIAVRERKRVLGWIEAVRRDGNTWLEGLQDQIITAVRDRPGVTTRELTAALPDLKTKIMLGSGKWATETAIGSRVLFLLAMDLRLVRTAPAGSWKSSQYGWDLPSAVSSVEPDVARAHLVQRYVERFGPVTTTDITWWTGLTVAQTKRALTDAGAEAVSLDGADGWQLGEAPAAIVPMHTVTLLPGLDPTPMGYKERAWFLGAHQAAVFDRNGNVGPTIWLDGRIVGGWAVRSDGSVVTRLLEDVGAEAKDGVRAQAAALTTWLDGTSITPRFRTPLERELTEP